MSVPRLQREKNIRAAADRERERRKIRKIELFSLEGSEKLKYDIGVLESQIKGVKYDLVNALRSVSNKTSILQKLENMEKTLEEKRKELIGLEHSQEVAK